MMADLEIKLLVEHLHSLFKSPYIQILFWIVCFDIVSGYIKAFKLKRFDSKTSTNEWATQTRSCYISSHDSIPIC